MTLSHRASNQERKLTGHCARPTQGRSDPERWTPGSLEAARKSVEVMVREDMPLSRAAQPSELSWQGESEVQSYDLDCVGSIPAMPRRRLPALLSISINKNVCILSRSAEIPSNKRLLNT